MTQKDYDYLSKELNEIMQEVYVNRSLEYMVYLQDDYMDDENKYKIDISGLMLHASQNSDKIIEKLDKINLYILEQFYNS